MRQPPHYRYIVDGLPRLGEKKPLLLFLHGKGERGSDLSALRAHGPPELFPEHGLDRFILLSPQCPAEDSWDPDKLQEFLSGFRESYPIDPRRIYLTGLSLGGTGGWNLLLRRPYLFARAVLICGRIDLSTTRGLARPSTPLWLVHSAADEIVPVSHSDGLFDALRAVGADVTYTRYAGLAHVQTWKEAYGSNLLFDWLLES